MTNPDDSVMGIRQGLTKREWFSGMAKVPEFMIEKVATEKNLTGIDGALVLAQFIASFKVKIADALIAKLSKETK